jgi:hypothetical protein
MRKMIQNIQMYITIIVVLFLMIVDEVEKKNDDSSEFFFCKKNSLEIFDQISSGWQFCPNSV